MSTPSTLTRGHGTALHRQIFLVLRDGIVQGTYAPGAALPKEEALVELFGVARMTVRRALADLEAEGLVQRRHGSGTFVRAELSTGATTASLSYVDELKRTAQSTEVRSVTIESVSPPAWVSAALHIPHDETAVHVTRLRVAGETPLMVTDAWIAQERSARLTTAALKKKALYEILISQGISFGRVVQEITAESADPVKADMLQCELSTALIRLTRLLHDESGRPVYHLTAHILPRYSRILMEIPSDAINTLSAGHIVHDPELQRAAHRAPQRSKRS